MKRKATLDIIKPEIWTFLTDPEAEGPAPDMYKLLLALRTGDIFCVDDTEYAPLDTTTEVDVTETVKVVNPVDDAPGP